MAPAYDDNSSLYSVGRVKALHGTDAVMDVERAFFGHFSRTGAVLCALNSYFQLFHGFVFSQCVMPMDSMFGCQAAPISTILQPRHDTLLTSWEAPRRARGCRSASRDTPRLAGVLSAVFPRAESWCYFWILALSNRRKA